MRIIHVNKTEIPNNFNIKIAAGYNDMGYPVTWDNVILMNDSVNKQVTIPSFVDVDKVVEPVEGIYIAFNYRPTPSSITSHTLQDVIRYSDMTIFPTAIDIDNITYTDIMSVYNASKNSCALAMKPVDIDAVFILPTDSNITKHLYQSTLYEFGDTLANTIIDMLTGTSLFGVTQPMCTPDLSDVDTSNLKSIYACKTFVALTRVTSSDSELQYVLIYNAWSRDGHLYRRWLYDSGINPNISYIKIVVEKIFELYKRADTNTTEES